MNTIEIILSPVLFKYRVTSENYIVVVIDVLRATTAFCAAFDSGVETVIPVAALDELLVFKMKGYLTAAERDGRKVDFADFGNSPKIFLQHNLAGKKLAYSTTNGTQAIEMAKVSGNIAVACFANLKAISTWIRAEQKNIIILCSGWKNSISLEDTLCAGALANELEHTGLFLRSCDASEMAINQWKSSHNQLEKVVSNANHYQRLEKLGQYDDLHHCFILNTSEAVPVWDGIGFINKNA